jgi:hypothetical protein
MPKRTFDTVYGEEDHEFKEAVYKVLAKRARKCCTFKNVKVNHESCSVYFAWFKKCKDHEINDNEQRIQKNIIKYSRILPEGYKKDSCVFNKEKKHVLLETDENYLYDYKGNRILVSKIRLWRSVNTLGYYIYLVGKPFVDHTDNVNEVSWKDGDEVYVKLIWKPLYKFDGCQLVNRFTKGIIKPDVKIICQ